MNTKKDKEECCNTREIVELFLLYLMANEDIKQDFIDFLEEDKKLKGSL